MDEETKNAKTTEEAIAEAIAKLEAKNKELIGEVRALKTAKTEAEEAAEAAQNEANEKSGNIEAIKAAMQSKHDKELKTRDENIKKLTGELSVLKIDNVVAEAVAKSGAYPDQVENLKDLIKMGVVMGPDGEPNYNGMPLNDRIDEIMSRDSTKRLLAAPLNSGGGSTGSTIRTVKQGMTPPTNLSDWNAKQWYEHLSNKDS